EECGQLRLAHGLCALARHADGNADLAPERVGHAEHGDLADPGMGQYLLLDLTRIDVGAAGDVHVGSTAGDVDKPLFVDVAEIAVILPVTSPRPKYCTITGPSLFSAAFWSSRYIGAPA